MIELCFVLDLVLNSQHNPAQMYHRTAFLPSYLSRNAELGLNRTVIYLRRVESILFSDL
jgi:hypothetical protein